MMIRMIPPEIIAGFLYLVPKTPPAYVPAADMAKVTTAITHTANTVLISTEAKRTFTGMATNVTPTASASMLVAMARGNIALIPKSADSSSAPENPSLTMLKPMIARMMNAT